MYRRLQIERDRIFISRMRCVLFRLCNNMTADMQSKWTGYTAMVAPTLRGTGLFVRRLVIWIRAFRLSCCDGDITEMCVISVYPVATKTKYVCGDFTIIAIIQSADETDWVLSKNGRWIHCVVHVHYFICVISCMIKLYCKYSWPEKGLYVLAYRAARTVCTHVFTGCMSNVCACVNKCNFLHFLEWSLLCICV